MWDAIDYPLPNFNGAAVEVWEWINNSTPYFTVHVITFHAVIKVKPIKRFQWIKYIHRHSDGIVRHYSDVIMGSMSFQITSLAIVYSDI